MTGGSFAAYLLQTLVSLVAVSALAFGVLWAVRRFGGPQTKGPLALVGQLPLGGTRAIYVVKVGSQHLVVGAGEGGLSKLGELSDGDAALFTDAAIKPSPRFADALARALGKPAVTTEPAKNEDPS